MLGARRAVVVSLAALLILLVSDAAWTRPPFAPGDAYYQFADHEYNRCTAGFLVKDMNGNIGMLTAGHCDIREFDKPGPNGLCVSKIDPRERAHLCHRVGHIADADLNDDIAREHARGEIGEFKHAVMDYDASVDPEHFGADDGLISINSNVRVTSKIVGNRSVTRAVNGQQIRDSFIGSKVCKYGAVTGETCGVIVSSTDTFVSIDGATFAHGDSGGPVYIVTDDDHVIPVGVVSNSTYGNPHRFFAALIAPMLKKWNLELVTD